MNYLTEAFKQMELLESEQFTFDKDGAVKLGNFLDDDMLNDFEAIIDPEAETTDELKTSYMGNVICKCPICNSLIYRDPETIVIDQEEQLANVEDPCPYCFEQGGFEIVGQVAPYEEIKVETTDNDDTIKVEVDGEDVTVGENTEDEEEVLEESLTEASIYDKLVKAYPELAQNDRQAKKRHTRDNEDLEDSQRYPIESPVGTEGLKESVEGNEDKPSISKRIACKRRHTRDNEDLEDSQRYPVESPAPAQTGLREGMEDISITTDDQVIKVKATPREDKEAIQPLEKETIDKIETINKTPAEETIPEEDEELIDLEEIDEESFNTLGESYLKEVYENVNSFKTVQIKSQDNQLIVEGVITFNSGKKVKTSFLFESKEMTRNGKLKFSGLNENISTNKKAFTLTGFIADKKLILESLNYNYSAKVENGKSKRLYGTIRL